MIDDPIFYAAVIPAVILCGLGKGGFTGAGVLAMPLTALVMSPVRGASILLPILCIQDLVGVWAYRRTWDLWNLSVMLPVFFALGQFTRENVLTSLGLFPLAVAATWGGLHLVRKVPAERFYRVIYLLLLVVGAKLLWDGSRLFR